MHADAIGRGQPGLNGITDQRVYEPVLPRGVGGLDQPGGHGLLERA
jgi:hypothetical protein